MAANKLNVIKQSDVDWEYEVSAGEDKPTASLSYTDDFQGWAARCPLVNSAHPDISALKLNKIKATRLPGDQVRVDLSYVSMANDGVPGKPASPSERLAKYYVQVSSREEHILTNKYAEDLDDAELKALFAISNGTEADENGVPYADSITSAIGLELLKKIRKGNIAFKTGSLIYGQRKVITTLADLNYLKIGKIDSPPGPVSAPSGSWLYISASADPVPTDEVAWQADFQWEYSPDGWDPHLYTAPSP
jgi:hypothetical protein